MIVIVTLNPALRVEYLTRGLELGQDNAISGIAVRASGGALTAARLLTTFGHDVVVAGLAGGSAGDLIRADLGRAGVAARFTRIAAESRRVVSLVDRTSGQVTRLAEPAPYITTEELGRLAGDFRRLLDGADAVLLCGSLPAGLPPDIYGSLTSYAADAADPVIVAVGDEALQHAVRRGPALVIPELAAEAAERGAAPAGGPVAAGPSAPGSAVPGEREPGTAGGLAAAGPSAPGEREPESAGGPVAAGPSAPGSAVPGERGAASAGWPVPAGSLSLGWSPAPVGPALALLGPRGVRVLTGQDTWLAGLPASGLPAVRRSGGGTPADGPASDRAAAFRDALVAGFVPGVALSWSWPDMLRHAVALAGSVDAGGEADLAAYEALLPAVVIARG